MNGQRQSQTMRMFLEQSVQAVFYALVAVVLGVVIHAASPILAIPVVFFSVVVSLLAIGVAVWAWSENRIIHTLSMSPLSEDLAPSAKKQETSFEFFVLFFAWIESFLLYMQRTPLNLLTVYWKFSVFLALGIIFFYGTGLMLIRVSTPQAQSALAREKENEIKAYVLNLFQKLPSISLGVFFCSSFAPMVLGHYWGMSMLVSVGALAVVALMHRTQEPEPSSTPWIGVRAQSRRFVFQVVLSLLMSFLSGVLVMHAALIMANPIVVLLVFASCVFGIQMWLVSSKLTEIKESVIHQEPPSAELSDAIMASRITKPSTMEPSFDGRDAYELTEQAGMTPKKGG